MLTAEMLRVEIEASRAIGDGAAFPDGTVICKGITYRVKDGEGYYEVAQEFRDHVRSIMEGDPE